MNAETDSIDIDWTLGVWDEYGRRIMQRDINTKLTQSQAYTIPVDIQPGDDYVTCILQIRKWKATKIKALAKKY